MRSALFIFLILMSQVSTATLSLSERIEYHSRQYLGRLYLESPLGEGSGAFDADPRIRFDAFDCTTYVETVLALAISDMPGFNQSLIEILDSIRYRATPSGIPLHDFQNRAHFTSADWIPNLKNQGLVQDITTQIFKSFSQNRTTEIDRQSWFLKTHGIQFSAMKEIVSLPVIKLSVLRKNPRLWNLIPNGAIINFVGQPSKIKEKSGTDLDVRHQGIAIRNGGKLYLRHAKSTLTGVVEEPILDAVKYPYLTSVDSINVLIAIQPQR